MPFAKTDWSTPTRSQNKPPLSFPLLQSKVAFKKRNNLRFCLPNSESPRGKGWEQSKGLGTEQLVPQERVTTACEEGGEGHRRQSPNLRLDSRERKGSSCVPLGPIAQRELRSYQILLGHTMWPLSFSTFSMALASLPIPHK